MGTHVAAARPIQPVPCPPPPPKPQNHLAKVVRSKLAMGPPKASKLLFVGASLSFGVCTNCRMENFQFFFDIVMIHNASYVKHVLDPLSMFSPYLGSLGGRARKGLGHKMQFSVLSKMEISDTDFFLYCDHSPCSNILFKACFRPY